MKKIAITGGTGLVGSRVVELLSKDFEFIILPSKDLDITNKDAVHTKLKDLDYDVFLHMAAYTNVDGAEKEKEVAYKLNVDGTKNVLEATLDKKAHFIYISTGFVFDGQNPPYDEDSTAKPIGYYGETKYEGEKLVQGNGMIVRPEYPYRASFEPKKDFVRVLKFFLEQGRQIQGIENSLITPTFIDDFAYGLKYLINNYSPETFNLVGADSLSPFESAKLIAKAFNLDETLIAPTTYEKYFEGKAKRPQWAEVTSKKNNFYKMKSFEEGLLEMKKQLT